METERKPKLKIAICDDEASSLERLRKLTEETLGETWALSILCTDSPEQMLEEAEQVQIALLDIQLSEENGIELSRRIMERNPECCIIFVSGYIQFVSDVYEVPHLCMVLKDQLAVQLPKYLLRAAYASGVQGMQLELKINGTDQTMDLEMVSFLERRGHITYINLKNGQQIQTREKLEEILKRIISPQICRCHISYAANLQWVESMREKEFVMHDGVIVPISRVNKQLVRKQYFEYLKSRI